MKTLMEYLLEYDEINCDPSILQLSMEKCREKKTVFFSLQISLQILIFHFLSIKKKLLNLPTGLSVLSILHFITCKKVAMIRQCCFLYKLHDFIIETFGKNLHDFVIYTCFANVKALFHKFFTKI